MAVTMTPSRTVARRASAVIAACGALIGCGKAPLDAVILDPATLTSGLVAHWTFDDGAGTVVRDQSGNGHDGVLTGGTWISSGRFGGALSLASGDSIAVASFPQATSGWTVSVWTRSSAADLASASDISTVISAETVFAGGWQIHLDNRPNYHRFDAAYWSGPNTMDYVVTLCPCIEADRWIHLTSVWDASAGKTTLYLDDQAVDDAPMPTPILTGDSTLYMGTWNMFNRFLVGDLDDFAIWGRALQPTEIAAISSQSPGS
jgi:hypothetical protein